MSSFFSNIIKSWWPSSFSPISYTEQEVSNSREIGENAETLSHQESQIAREDQIARDAEYASQLQNEEMEIEQNRRDLNPEDDAKIAHQEREDQIARDAEYASQLQNEENKSANSSIQSDEGSNLASSKGKEEEFFFSSSKINEDLEFKKNNSELSQTERIKALNNLYNNKASDGRKILYHMPSNIVIGEKKGIQNINNSCTIASLLFNIFGATSFFDQLLLVGSTEQENNNIINWFTNSYCTENQVSSFHSLQESEQIRIRLILIANALRSNDSIVDAKRLQDFCSSLMGSSYGSIFQPDEFLGTLFKKLDIDWKSNNDEFIYYSITQKKLSEVEEIYESVARNFSGTAIDLIQSEKKDYISIKKLIEKEQNHKKIYKEAIVNLDPENLKKEDEFFLNELFNEYCRYVKSNTELTESCKNLKDLIKRVKTEISNKSYDISGDKNKVLFIQIPRQGTIAFHKRYQDYKYIIPSLNIEFEGKKYNLQSIVTNVGDCHSESWVILSNDINNLKLYHFNGGGNGQAEPEVKAYPKIYDYLSGKCNFSQLDLESQKVCDALTANAAFFIYIRDEDKKN